MSDQSSLRKNRFASVFRRLFSAFGGVSGVADDPPEAAATDGGLVYTVARSHEALPPTFGDTVRRLDRELFVGRDRELAIFRQWVLTDASVPLLLNVSGPTGIGKSSLLRAFRRFAGGLGRPVRLVDGHDFPATPAGFVNALGGSHQAEVLRHINQVGPILLLDSFEMLEGLWQYLRDEFLSGLEVGVKVAIAGRQPLSHAWAADRHWHRLIRPLPLDGLSTMESRTYLRRCGLEEPRLVRDVLNATSGYPVLVSLAASLLELSDVRVVSSSPKWHLIIHSVAEHLLTEVEGPSLRSLLSACAVIGPFDEATLAALSGQENGEYAFARLRNVSLVHPTKAGLTVQHNVRRVLVDDLKWRRPDTYRALRTWVRARSAATRTGTPLPGLQLGSANELRTLPRDAPVRRRLPRPDDLQALTPREREVLGVLASGLMTSRQIADELVISKGTANLHVKRVLRKLGFVSRAELAHWWAIQTLPEGADNVAQHEQH